jgi:hypothetical protein
MANETSYPQVGDRTLSARAQRAEHWRRVVARQQQSGLSMAAFCAREPVKASALSWWARELRKRESERRKPEPKEIRRKRRRPVFVPVRVIEAAPSTSAPAVEVLTRDGHVVRVGPGFDPATLRRTVAALEGRPC